MVGGLFLYDWTDITFSQVVDAMVVTIELEDESIIFEETFYPDEEQKVVIRDLASILKPYFTLPALEKLDDEVQVSPFSFTVSGRTSSAANFHNGRVFYSRTAVGVHPADVLALCHYAEVDTVPGAEEYFPVLNYSGLAMTIGVAYLVAGQAKYKVVDVSLGGEGAISYRVSPSRIARLANVSLDAILYYIVTVTTPSGLVDRVKYVIDRSRKRQVNTFLYLNGFGVPETFTAYGAVSYEPELEGETVSLMDGMKRIDNEWADVQTVFTGYMKRDKYESLKDMLTSPDIRLLENGRNIPVVITECDAAYKPMGNERINVSFSFRPSAYYAGRFGRVPSSENRIFDKTFDVTFD